MEKFIIGCAFGIILGFVFGTAVADGATVRVVKEYTGYTWSQLHELKADCEVSLPRDKFCKLEIKAVEDK